MTPLYYAMKKAKQERRERIHDAILYAVSTVLIWTAGIGFMLFIGQLKNWLHL